MQFGVCYGALLLVYSLFNIGKDGATEHQWVLYLLHILVGGSVAGIAYSNNVCQLVPRPLLGLLDAIGARMSAQEWNGFVAAAMSFFAFSLVALRFEPSALAAGEWILRYTFLSLGAGLCGVLIVDTIDPRQGYI